MEGIYRDFTRKDKSYFIHKIKQENIYPAVSMLIKLLNDANVNV
jgi:hypothetical protein